MARKPNTPQEPTDRVPPAKTDNTYLTFLIRLHPGVEKACEGQPDTIKAALQAIAGAINTLENSIRTNANLERS